jgi:FAD/FMN-containing dehydrogenase
VPETAGTLLVAMADLDTLGDVVSLLQPCGPVAIELLDRSFLDLAPVAGAAVPLEGARAVLLVDFEARTEAEVRDALDRAEREVAPTALRTRAGVSRFEREMLWRLRHGASAALAALPPERRSLQIVEDGCVPVGMLGRYLAGVRRAAEEAGVPIVAFGHAGDGHLHVNALVDTTVPAFERRMEQLLESVTALVVGLGGTPSGEHGDGRLRAGALERVYGPEVTALFAAVKRTFDPPGVLNPGVIVPDGTPPLAGLKVGPAAAPIPDDIARRLRHREGVGAWALPPLTLLDPAP